MAKFGLFSGQNEDPSQTYEGEMLILNAQTSYVEIRNDKNQTTAVIRLAEGQSVKKLEAEAATARR